MHAKVIWGQGMRFTGSANSGFELPLDADPGSGGVDGGFRPLELLLIGLAGCTAMDVISIIRKKRQDVTAFNVQVHATQQADEYPHVFTSAEILYQITGRSLDEIAVRRAIELSTLHYCPAQAMFNGVFPMTLLYELYEEREHGEPQLVKQGKWEAEK
jgi:putative redox protein